MVDSSTPSGDRRDRSERPQNSRPARSSSSARGSQPRGDRGGKPAERGSWQKRDGAPGERKSWGSSSERGQSGERKPWEKRDGKPGERSERKPWESRGERSDRGRPSERRDSKPGERKSWGSRDGKPGERSERKPWENRDNRSGERSERKPWEKRDGKPGERSERKPWENRDSRPGERRDSKPGERKPWENRGERSDRGRSDDRPRREFRDSDGNFEPRHNDPELPDSVIARDLDKGAYAELKGLSKENAERVARHLVASALALEVDPELAHKHALAAARTAGRIAVVRETVAITAYETGDYALALRELRTYRRLSGKNTHIALIVDSERGLGRPERALEEGRAVDRATLPAESRVALAIAMSGARLDLNQPELALGELEIAELDANRAFTYSPMLFHAYAEVLDELGRAKESADWRHRAEVAQAAIDEEYGVHDVIEVYEEIDEAIGDVVEAAEPSDSDADETGN